MNYSKGITWFDDCRIPFVDEGDKSSAKPHGKTLKHKGWDNEKFNSGSIRTKTGYGDKGSNSRYYDIDLWFNNLLENNIY